MASRGFEEPSQIMFIQILFSSSFLGSPFSSQAGTIGFLLREIT